MGSRLSFRATKKRKDGKSKYTIRQGETLTTENGKTVRRSYRRIERNVRDK